MTTATPSRIIAERMTSPPSLSLFDPTRAPSVGAISPVSLTGPQDRSDLRSTLNGSTGQSSSLTAASPSGSSWPSTFLRVASAPPCCAWRATSALDYESERIIQDNMRRIVQGRTVFIIAHRLSTVRRVDRIITLERGRIIEDGTHDELIRKGGRYAKLHYLQAG